MAQIKVKGWCFVSHSHIHGIQWVDACDLLKGRGSRFKFASLAKDETIE